MCRESCFSECHLCFVKDVPAADVVEVVRCKDCVYGTLCENMAGCKVNANGTIQRKNLNHFMEVVERMADNETIDKANG